jgi:hypothetical protein
MNSADHTALVAAVKAADPVATLESGAVHGVCAGSWGVYEVARRDSGYAAQAGEQSDAGEDFDVPRRGEKNVGDGPT